ncbi:MAG: nucleotidyltransferase domain-containing protein, partial [Thermodesulfobacteriota bacterium]
MKTNKIFKTKIENYFRNRPVLKAYLFGSFSRAEADDSSDVDIL